MSKEEEDEEPYNPEEYVGPFQKADESELATRRIVKVKRRNKPKEKSDEDTMTSTSNVGFLWDFSKTSSQQSESSGFENAWKPPDFTSGFGANLNKEASKPTLFSFNFATGTEESKTEDQTQLINDLRRENEELKEKVKKLLEENKRLGGSASTTGNISPTTTTTTTTTTTFAGTTTNDAESKSDVKNEDTSKGFLLFGSGQFDGFTGSNAFPNFTLNKDDVPTWNESSGAAEENTEEQYAFNVPTDIKFSDEPVKTGEEEEETLFQEKCKLYEMLKDEKGAMDWKERGIGILKLNIKKNEPKARLIMRKEDVLTVILNTTIFKGMKCLKRGGKSVLINSFNESGILTSFLLKFQAEETADKFVSLVSEQASKLP